MGLVLGLGGAFMLGAVLKSILVEMSPADPLTLAAVTAVLTIVTVTASVIPAARATRIDPVIALRAE